MQLAKLPFFPGFLVVLKSIVRVLRTQMFKDIIEAHLTERKHHLLAKHVRMFQVVNNILSLHASPNRNQVRCKQTDGADPLDLLVKARSLFISRISHLGLAKTL